MVVGSLTVYDSAQTWRMGGLHPLNSSSSLRQVPAWSCTEFCPILDLQFLLVSSMSGLQRLTKNSLAIHDAETWIQNGYCLACRKTITTLSLRMHLQSSTHRWRTGYACRESVIRKHMQFIEGEGNLADYLPVNQEPVLEYFTHVTFRLLSGLEFAQFEVSSSPNGMLD